MNILNKAYDHFFRNEGGEHLMQVITEIITTNHLRAEKEPENARDYVQRAKGAREVLDHIQSVLASKEKQRKQ